MDSADVKLLVEAQDRTTHAVRAIAVYLITALLADTIGGFLFWIGLGGTMGSSGYGQSSVGFAGISLFGLFVLGVGNLVALLFGASELNASEFLSPAKTVYCTKCGRKNHKKNLVCNYCDQAIRYA